MVTILSTRNPGFTSSTFFRLRPNSPATITRPTRWLPCEPACPRPPSSRPFRTSPEVARAAVKPPRPVATAAESTNANKGQLWPRSHGTAQITIAEIAKKLAVAYVLDGSVRKSGARLRVDARLIRADNGYVVWSESYDRPFDDILLVQEDIAGEVAKALRASIDPANLLREQ